MRRVIAVVNPAARRGERAERALRKACAARGIPCEIHRTTAPGDAARIAARLAPALADGEPLFAVGGDGTVVEVASAIAPHARRGVACAIIAAGTGNQLAKLHGVPRSPARALAAYLRASASGVRARAMDLALTADGRHIALTAGLGVDAMMIRGASRRLKRWLGVGAYLWAVVRALLHARDFDVRIVADGQVIERKAALVGVLNVAKLFPGPMPLGPGIRDDDGWLDLAIVSLGGPFARLRILLRLGLRDFRPHPQLMYLRAKALRIEAAADTPAQGDGEILPSGTLEIGVVPGGALFALPQR